MPKRKYCKNCGLRNGHRKNCIMAVRVPNEDVPPASAPTIGAGTGDPPRIKCALCRSSGGQHKRFCPNILFNPNVAGPSNSVSLVPPVVSPTLAGPSSSVNTDPGVADLVPAPNYSGEPMDIDPPDQSPVRVVADPPLVDVDIPVHAGDPMEIDPPDHAPIMVVGDPPLVGVVENPPLAVVENPPVAVVENPPGAVIVPPINEECECCHRTFSPFFPLILVVLGENFKRRRIVGDTIMLTNLSMVCESCRGYLHGSDAWKDVWCSTLYSIITNPLFTANIPSLSMIPKGIIRMWEHLRNRHVDTIPFFENEETVSYLKPSLDRFNEENNDPQHRLFKECHERECFPRVTCPAGCSMFVDDPFYLEQVHHFIRHINPHFNLFRANANRVVGKRGDWPYVGKVISFVLKGASIIDAQKGLCIVVCTAHSDLSHEYVHVPKNPVLAKYGLWDGERVDMQAPIRASVNFVKRGKCIKGRTNRFANITLNSTRNGFSTFRLATNPDDSETYSDFHRDAEILTYYNRSDTKRNVPAYKSEEYDGLPETFKAYIGHTDAEIRSDWESTGTFITTMESIAITSAYNSSDGKSISNLFPLPLSASHGRTPFGSIINNSIPRFHNKALAVLSLVVTSIGNCRSLYIAYIAKEKVTDRNTPLGAVYHGLLGYLTIRKLKEISSPKRKREMWREFAAELYNVVANVYQLNENTSVELFTAYFLQGSIGGDTLSVFNWYRNCDPATPFETGTDFIIVTQALVNLHDVNEEGTHKLLLKASSTNDRNRYSEELFMRWTPDLKWIRYGKDVYEILDEFPDAIKPLNIFVSVPYLIGKVNNQSFSFDGIQSVMTCYFHQNSFLMREDAQTELRCPDDGCNRKLYWRCPVSHGQPEQCRVGICSNRGRQLLLDAQQVSLDLVANIPPAAVPPRPAAVPPRPAAEPNQLVPPEHDLPVANLPGERRDRDVFGGDVILDMRRGRPCRLPPRRGAAAAAAAADDDDDDGGGGEEIQRVIRCFFHRAYLIREEARTELRCPDDGCNRKLYWRCPESHGQPEQCRVGICSNRGRQFLLHAQQLSLEHVGIIPPAAVLLRPIDEPFEPEHDLPVANLPGQRRDRDVFGDNVIGDGRRGGRLPQRPRRAAAGGGGGVEEEEAAAMPIVDHGQEIQRGTEPAPMFTDGYGRMALVADTSTHTSSSMFLLRGQFSGQENVMYAKKPTVRHQQTLHHLYSKTPESSFPLAHPDGALHPKIFYSNRPSAPIGSMPNVSYTKYGNEDHPGGLASFNSHVQVRMRDLLSPTSRDVGYTCHSFDAVLNRHCDANSIRSVAKKGLETVNRVYFDRSRNQDHKLEFVGGTFEADRLAKTMKDTGSWSYFITISCNDNRCPALAKIKIEIDKAYGLEETKERNTALQNLLYTYCRLWERYVRHFFQHLLKCDEDIFGAKAKHYWYRYEFQSAGALGNLPHVHGGVVLEENLLYRDKFKKTSCRSQEILSSKHFCDWQTLLLDGFIEDIDDVANLGKELEKLHKHKCKNSRFRCQKRGKNNKLHCRVPRYEAACEGRVEPMIPQYANETTDILVELGLADRNSDDLGLPEELVGLKFHYAAPKDVVCTPTNGKLFCFFQSTTNVQCVDHSFRISYLCKYAAGDDEKRDVLFQAPLGDAEEVVVERFDLYHAKISGAALNEAKFRKETKAAEPQAKEICLTEMAWFLLNLPYLVTDVEYVYVSLLPLERRGTTEKSHRNAYSTVRPNNVILTIENRRELAEWRRFTRNQGIHISDILDSTYYPDNMTRFNVRPPELRFIQDVETYCRWFSFSHDPIPNCQVSVVLSELPFQDGIGRVVKIRKMYLTEVSTFFRDVAAGNGLVGVPDGAQQVSNLLSLLLIDVTEIQPTDLLLRFVNMESTKEVVVFYRHVPPCNIGDFLYYCLLRFGNITCERDIFAQGTLKSAYQNAGLMRDAAFPTNAEFLALSRRYVMEELVHLQIRQRKLESYLKSAIHIFRRFYTNLRVFEETMPLITEIAIQDEATAKLDTLERECLRKLLDTLVSMQLPGFPGRQAVVDGEALGYVPRVEMHANQSRESLEEQRKVLQFLVRAINRLADPHVCFIRSQWLVGPPGSGKTHIMLNAVAYCVSQQIKCMVISLTAERARAIGGYHLHLVFCLPVDHSSSNVEGIVDAALRKLALSPHRLAFLKRLRVLFFEEIGLISSEMLSTIDLIFRFIKSDDRPFGGVIFFATGDHRQLSPINGTHVWLSNTLLTSVDVYCLKHLVRSGGDEDLQRLITIMRTPRIHNDQVFEAKQIFRERCRPQAVASWDQVESTHLRIVGTKAAVEESETQYIQQMLNRPGVEYRLSRSLDEVCLRGAANWIPASPDVVNELNYKLAERENLYLFMNAVMQLTFNNNHGTRNMPLFSQGQRCVIVRLPPPEQENGAQDQIVLMHVRLIPTDATYTVGNPVPAEWPLAVLKRRKSPGVTGRRYGALGRREQWPLRYYVCQTVHRTMGDTLSRVATMIAGQKIYTMWEREMLMVLISRVRNLDHIVFVGPFEATLAAIGKLLNRKVPIVVEIHRRMQSLDVIDDPPRPPVLRPSQQRYKGLHCQIPSDNVGFVYLMVSACFPTKIVIREGLNLREDMSYFNSSVGDPSTLHIRPWLLAAYACRFPTDPAENQRVRTNLYTRWTTTCLNFDGEFNRKPYWYEAVQLGIDEVTAVSLDARCNLLMNVCLEHQQQEQR